MTINFNGRNINFMTTHFDPYTASYRLTQARDLVTYMKGFAENRIVAGDFNDQPGNPPITTMTAAYYDAWAEAKKAGIAYSPPDNPNGYTRNSRIDYIFYSRGEQHLTLQEGPGGRDAQLHRRHAVRPSPGRRRVPCSVGRHSRRVAGVSSRDVSHRLAASNSRRKAVCFRPRHEHVVRSRHVGVDAEILDLLAVLSK